MENSRGSNSQLGPANRVVNHVRGAVYDLALLHWSFLSATTFHNQNARLFLVCVCFAFPRHFKKLPLQKIKLIPKADY